MNDYEAHLGSYDHSHKQRLKDMKAMVKDPSAGARARKAEAKAGGIVSIKLPDKDASTGGAGFKKGGFKKSGFKSAMTAVTADSTPAAPKPTVTTAPPNAENGDESDTEDEGYEVYDPRYPTD